MKWKNKGHEIDNFALEICNIFDQKKGVIVYGAGNVGTRIYRALKRYDLFHKFVDNDTQKQKSGFFVCQPMQITKFYSMLINRNNILVGDFFNLKMEIMMF